ncbi:MAG: DNA recombination protein RmuC [Spirochaetaceae bacterium]|jgi:DNA recombination protein RmuC|nr:DNA recombination protein RmuC [Spirochaetaceae bacterium]
MEYIFILAVFGILVIQLVLILMLLFKSRQGSPSPILQKLIEYDARLDKNENNLRDEFGRNREETNKSAKENREELSSALKTVEEKLSAALTNFTGLVDNKIKSLADSLDSSSKASREELSKNITVFAEGVTKSISGFSEILNKELQSVQDRVAASTKESREELSGSLKSFEEKSSARIEALTKDTKDGLEKNRETLEKKLAEIQDSNEKKLEKMRETVDEKLQKTLETRLNSSFAQVSDLIEKVLKGLGEMQNLASDVGDLKKVLSNVKTKGVLGEYQLEAILEEILHTSQYEKNVKTKAGSDTYVEFAIKIPSKEDSAKPLWLPIDSKLPTSAYENLIEAYDAGDKKAVEDARKNFGRIVKGFAKDIHDKYLDPPNTTDFGIMFLPFEGEYAEVVRDSALFEGIRRESNIIVTGPSTIAALLNALRVGFNSLAVDKNTGVIRDLLSAVKKEFINFEKILVKVKDQIDSAGSTLEKDVGVRTRAINRALKKVETLPDDAVGQKLLADASSDDLESAF